MTDGWGDESTIVPPMTGDRTALRRPGQSRGAAFRMWLGYALKEGLLNFVAILILAVVLYGLAFVLLAIRFGG